MEKLQVLLSSYNGREHIREQIDTILQQDCEEQTGIKVKLLVRDDGSTDQTQEILREYAERDPEHFAWYQGDNVGVIRSFFDLAAQADSEAAYFALADQDDYWERDKLSTAIRWHRSRPKDGRPHLYCCKPQLVDERLRPLTSEIVRPPMRPSFGNALVENIVVGCTAVMDRRLLEMVAGGIPDFTVMHDWWFYLTASCFGEVYYDEESHIRYRQHGDNAVGMNTSIRKELLDRLKRFAGNRRNISRQTGEFVRIFGQTPDPEHHMRLAKALVAGRHSLRIRFRLLRSHRIYRQRKNDDRIFRLIILSGSY